MKKRMLSVAIGLALAPWTAALAENGFTSREFFLSEAAHGGTGLIQTPTARMKQAGSFSINYSDNEEYRFWSASIQLFPWMESTVRYTDVRTQLYSPFPGFSGDQTLKDKGIDVKFRLLQEDYWWPELSVGFRDFGGTGFFDSEFISASKRFGNLDVHLGMGWGYLGRSDDISNPFCQLRDSFCRRGGGFGGRGGKIDYQNFFKGPVALFGGLEYQTPWQPLRLKLEYEANDYSRDRAGDMVQDSRWNAAAVYRWNNLDVNLNYQRGNTMGFGVSYVMNFHQLQQPKIDRAPRDLMAERPVDERPVDRRLRAMLRAEAGYLVTKLKVTDEQVILAGSQVKYRDYDESINRIARILATELPDTVTEYRIIEQGGTYPVLETVVNATEFKAAARYESLQPDIRSTYIRTAPATYDGTEWNYQARNRGLGYGLETFWLQMFGSPEAFYMFQGGVMPSVGYRLNERFSLNAVGKITLVENFDKFNFTVDAEDTPLPRVRTYIREYVTRSRFTMEALFANYEQRILPDVYAQAYGGYLETMYAGVGTEVLYRPVDSAWAIGFDLNYVQQRSFESDFALRDYKVLTGHVNVYWEPEFLEDTRLTFNIGRYLARDTGVTFDFTKRFDSGIQVGAFAAITNVSAEDYGEGSFTKGFYLQIPFDLMSLRPSRGGGYIPWIPIARDGGQPLNRPNKLIDSTERRSRFGG
ncbi:YjbH domain-containing protein [Alkalimonas collagenimarina]|uniref:YjbH domain-containing protein n=1 Tax=Alkalimonas collagenimarina TaxID=400390 RepID=A0ABT9H0S5_9GAMM|nr:YjbH domain-containing protein [Alkalimonas collagenimarina]MDP4536922.1 YjbH domain-containing protein [Alkalimonas collagenimarina]